MVRRERVFKNLLRLTVVLALGSVGRARGEDVDARWASLSKPASMDGRVFAMMEFENDVILGGEFTGAGGVGGPTRYSVPLCRLRETVAWSNGPRDPRPEGHPFFLTYLTPSMF
jgi:hypothetical protein